MGVEGEVETYDGSRGASSPRGFRIGGERHEVVKVLKTWIEETHGLEGLYRQYWDVVDQDEGRFLLIHYRESDFWEIEKVNP